MSRMIVNLKLSHSTSHGTEEIMGTFAVTEPMSLADAYGAASDAVQRVPFVRSKLSEVLTHFPPDPVNSVAAPWPGVDFMLCRESERFVGHMKVRPDVTLSEVFQAMSRDVHGLTQDFPSAAETGMRGGGKCQDIPYHDWFEAPEGATHAIKGVPTLWLKLAEDSIALFWRTAWGDKPAHWHDSGHPSSLYVDSPNVTARPVPEEIWSVSGDNGSWDYASLSELLNNNYRAVPDVLPKVCRGIVCKDDPASFIPDAGDIKQWMYDAAQESDGGEWADNYPEIEDGGEADKALEAALEPLRKWARRYCEPKFFTVKDVTQYQVTEEDVKLLLKGDGQ